MGDSIWTEATIAFLRAYHADGLSFEKLAQEINKAFKLNITRNAVIGKAARLGLHARKHQPNMVITPKRPRKRRALSLQPRPRALDLADRLLASDPQATMPMDQSEFAVTFEQLRNPHCRWPIGEPGSDEFRFCGAQKMEQGPYCARHHWISYRNPVRLTAEEAERAARARKQRAA